jgi:serine/threonine-protein kinase
MDMTTDDRGGDAPAAARGAPRLKPGTTLNDRYQIDELVARTFYGEIYRGRDLGDGRMVTIKAIPPQLIADAQVRTRLEREIQIAVQLDHKNVGATYGLFGAMVGSDPVSYLATEHIDGQSLREMIDKKKSGGRGFSIKGTYNVVAHLCNALIYAHGATVHGGLTPDSVLVNSAGRVKVVDFGLARTLRPLDMFQAQVRSGGLAGLPPEVATAPDSADARADIYSVGVILFELLTGRAPTESFERPSAAAPGVPAAVDAVVERCLRPLPSERYQSAQQLKDAIHAALGGEVGAPAAAQPRPVSSPSLPAMPAAPPAAKPAPAPARPAPVRPAPPPLGSSLASQGPPSPLSSAPPPSTSAPRQQPARPQVAPITKSFNVDSALSAVDVATERWLIQKDKLDFGPFNMRDVRSQIESGKILPEHVIIDTENGERRKVKDHPQLRQLVLDADARNSEKMREEAEAADRRKHRGKVVTLLGMIAAIVIVGGGAVGWYVMHMKPKVVREVIHDGADLDFLKGVEITMKVDPPAPKKPHGGHHQKPGGKPGEFDDTTNLGDASEGGGDETLDQSVVQRVMTQNFKVLVGCISEERRRNPSLRNVDMDFIIKGTGNVSAVKVNGQTGTPIAGCMYGKMQSVAFPKFNGSKTHASFSLALK